jgi:hypothetical protein
LDKEEELFGFAVEPFHEEFVGVVGGFVIVGVEGFWIEKKSMKYIESNF